MKRPVAKQRAKLAKLTEELIAKLDEIATAVRATSDPRVAEAIVLPSTLPAFPRITTNRLMDDLRSSIAHMVIDRGEVDSEVEMLIHLFRTAEKSWADYEAAIRAI